jgi:hypothetical protein
VASTDRTADFSIDFAPGSNSAKAVIANNGTDGAYATKFEIRGKRLFAYEPVTLEAKDEPSVDTYGERYKKFDMPYQGSP